jgi:hypothetical protein
MGKISKEHTQKINKTNVQRCNGRLRNFISDYLYTDEHLKWDKPPVAVCLLIDLSVTLPLKI